MTQNNDTTPTLTELRAAEREWKRAQYRASQKRDARGVFRAQRELERIWRQIDALVGR